MSKSEVTIVVVPRERFSCSIRSLERVYEVTDTPFELIYVDGRSPRRVRDQLRRLAVRHDFTLVRENRYLSPNRARNLAIPRVTTPYVVFMDNDVLVTPGWLDAMLTCAKETDAWAVGPLYFEGDPADEIIHMAGGDIEITGEHGRRQVMTEHRFQKVRLSDAPPLERTSCGYLEFHNILLRTDIFDRIGPLDEAYLATREHLDLCLKISDLGGPIWFEPAAQVTYLSPPPVPASDVLYFWLRWSEAWSRASLEHFCETYGVDPEYAERAAIMRRRRQAALAPLRKLSRRFLGARGDDAVGKVIDKVEPRLNRALTTVLGRTALT